MSSWIRGIATGAAPAEDAGELEHPPRDAGLRADGVRLDEPLRQRRDALGEEPHENLVDGRVHPREAP